MDTRDLGADDARLQKLMDVLRQTGKARGITYDHPRVVFRNVHGMEADVAYWASADPERTPLGQIRFTTATIPNVHHGWRVTYHRPSLLMDYARVALAMPGGVEMPASPSIAYVAESSQGTAAKPAPAIVNMSGPKITPPAPAAPPVKPEAKPPAKKAPPPVKDTKKKPIARVKL